MPKNTWQPGAIDFEQALRYQNPWFERPGVPPTLARPFERALARLLPARLQRDEPRRFHLVVGPRRVGKTTVMYQVVRALLASGVKPSCCWWLHLDHPVLARQPLGTWIRWILQAAREEPIYLFLDEVTYSTDWDLWLKTMYDEQWPVRVVATSSATAALRAGREESGVGRWEVHFLGPWLLSEVLALKGVPPVAEPPAGVPLHETLCALGGMSTPPVLMLLWNVLCQLGGFPEILEAFDQEGDLADTVLAAQQQLRADAVERAIYKDIPQVFRVDDPAVLERLVYVLAGQMTGLLSPKNISNELGISQPTVDRYLSYLVRSYLVFLAQAWSGRESKVQKRGRKLYFVDGAVRNAALLRGTRPLGDSAEQGLLRENAVAAHLHVLCQTEGVRLFHWRQGGREVDLVYGHPTAPVAFEVGSHKHGRRGLRAFVKRFPAFAGRCWLAMDGTRFTPPERDPEGIGTIPVPTLLYLVGCQVEHALRLRLKGR